MKLSKMLKMVLNNDEKLAEAKPEKQRLRDKKWFKCCIGIFIIAIILLACLYINKAHNKEIAEQEIAQWEKENPYNNTTVSEDDDSSSYYGTSIELNGKTVYLNYGGAELSGVKIEGSGSTVKLIDESTGKDIAMIEVVSSSYLSEGTEGCSVEEVTNNGITYKNIVDSAYGNSVTEFTAGGTMYNIYWYNGNDFIAFDYQSLGDQLNE